MHDGQRNSMRGLYAITPDESDSDRLAQRVAAVLAGKPALLQYRNKTAGEVTKAGQARRLLALCRAAGVPLIINDDANLAALVGADGVHLGADDGNVAAARRIVGANAIIGVSCYADLAWAERADAEGASYVAFGSVYASPTKPYAVRADIDLLKQARYALALPLCAIGGITRTNARPIVDAGIDMLAVITDVFDSADPQAVANEFAGLFERLKSTVFVENQTGN